MAGSYDEYMGSPMDVEDHPAKTTRPRETYTHDVQEGGSLTDQLKKRPQPQIDQNIRNILNQMDAPDNLRLKN